MATFSWSDTARAVFGSCLPWLRSSARRDDDDDNHQQFTRRDELESLLQGAELGDAEMDSDALSLHSQTGQRQDGRKRVRRKRGRNKGSITLFGFDLFGRPLSAPDAEEEPETNRRISRMSSSTLDSDAAPLADEAIAQLSTQTQALREADESRKARKELRRQKKSAALLGTPDNAFEGFPGSGPPPEEFGAFQQAPAGAELGFVHVPGGGAEEAYGDPDAEAEGDFDASSYARNAAPRSDSGSGSHSRTSASDRPTPPHRIPLPPSSGGSTAAIPATKPKGSKKSGKRSATTESSISSQPRSPTTSAYVPRVGIASPTFEGFPEDEGFQHRDAAIRAFGLKLTGESVHGDLEADLPRAGFSPETGGFPSAGLGRSSGFPSPGLGGRKNSLSMSGNGAFLARTGADA